jgi:tetratricopeptide (TPR) repeat protein
MLSPARRAARCAPAAALVLALAPRPAGAQASPERDRQARAEFLAGREAFARGNYEEAARRFERAHELSGRPQLLYNIGTSYDRLHRWIQARDAFMSYLAEVPEAPERDEVRARLVVIEREIERERQLTEQARQRQVVVLSVPRERVIVRPVPAGEALRPWRVAGYVTGSLAVLAGATSATIALVTNAHYDRLVGECGQTPMGCPESAIADVELRATFVNVFLGTALVLGAASAASFAVDLSRPREAPASPTVRASLAPLLAPGATGAAVICSGAL